MKPSLLSLIAAAATALTFTACGDRSDSAVQSTATPLPSIDVATTTVTAQTEVHRRRLPGTVQATSRATIAAEIMGTVTASPVVGQTVEAGETLARISAPELTAAVAQARAALDLATRNYRREADLLARGASTEEMVQNLEDQRRMAAANLEGVTARLAQTEVTAPFAGVVTTRLLETGDLAAPGVPLFAIQGTQLEVQVAVPESLTALPVGESLMVELGDMLTVTAHITESSPAADPTTRSRLVRLALPSGTPAQPGQFVRVLWPDQTTTLVAVPASAITAFGQMQRVFVVSEGHASMRLVKVGRTESERTLVLSGLNPGETIVVQPPAHLRDGQAVNR
jgi:membrane fusion protein, multidrug efflux system